MDKLKLEAKLAQFDDHWAPRTIAMFNGHEIMVVKAKGEFVWHSHEDTDDLFLVLHGNLEIQLRDGSVHLEQGELVVIPRGVEHRPVAREEVHVLLMERAGTPNTGDPATAAKKVRI